MPGLIVAALGVATAALVAAGLALWLLWQRRPSRDTGEVAVIPMVTAERLGHEVSALRCALADVFEYAETSPPADLVPTSPQPALSLIQGERSA
jgi:uncharacterized iron-regulated membrane protein